MKGVFIFQLKYFLFVYVYYVYENILINVVFFNLVLYYF